MKISESIEAHLCSAVAAISQRNQATLSELVIKHPIHFTVFHRLYRQAKASSFCPSFYTNFRTTFGTSSSSKDREAEST